MIIQSILDNDLYKFSVSYAYMRLFPEAEGEFKFNDRDNTVYTEKFLFELKKELHEMCCNLHLTSEEFDWLIKSHISRFIPEPYWEWLRGWRLDYDKIKVWLDEENHLQITVTDKLYKCTYYEVPILAIVSELRNRMLGYKVNMAEMLEKLDKKIELSNKEGLCFSEFGTRRRFSADVQAAVVEHFINRATHFTGTSNVYLAMKNNLKAIGTFPHELVMFHAAMYGYRQANYTTLENWSKVYDGDLGIALTDTFTSKVFFDNFSRKQAKLFDGVRHDSGDPYDYIEMAINRYKELGIDPSTKTIIFSNALTMPEFKNIADACKGRIRCAAGIGTNLTNDTGNKPSNIVMKLSKARMSCRKDWVKCIKISDDLGKHMGNEEEFDLAKRTLGL